MTIDLTPLFQAIIGLLAAIITVYVVPAIKAKTTAEEQKLIEATVSVAVFAAEKLYGAGEGALKLRYVEDYLNRKGILLDTKELEAQVNAAIKGMELTEEVIEVE